MRAFRERLARNWEIMARHARVLPKPPPLSFTTVAAVVIAGFVLVTGIALLADAWIIKIASMQPELSRRFFQEITRLGKSDWVLIPSGVIVLVVAFGDWRSVARRNAGVWADLAAFAAVLFLVVAASGLLTDLLKFLIGRVRPNHADYVFQFQPLTFGYRYASFPSGHATTMGALAVVLATAPSRWRWWGAGFAGLVACSRFMIGVHHLSDVIAGLMVGAGVAYLIVRSMAYGGFGYRMASDGAIRWRIGRLRQSRKRSGWLAPLFPALRKALVNSANRSRVEPQ